MMQLFTIPTDESLRSMVAYGSAAFPLGYYLEDIEKLPAQCVEWHWHREFELSYVVSGSVCFKIGSQTVRRCTGDGLFINSGMLHHLVSEDGGITSTLVFSPEFIAPLDSRLFQRYIWPFLTSDLEYMPLHPETASHRKILSLMQQISRSMHDGSPLHELRIHNQLSLAWELLTDYLQSCPSGSQSHKSRLTQARLKAMLEYIHTNYAQPIGLNGIAAAASISKSEALRCFHTGVQTTPMSYLNEYRLSRAKERLLSTNDTVASIALSTGFESAGYFTRVFKQKCGSTPNAFRSAKRTAPREDAG